MKVNLAPESSKSEMNPSNPSSRLVQGRALLEQQRHQYGYEEPLSRSEYEILDRLAKGMMKREIADGLKICYSTVDYRVGRIYKKLRVRNAAAAVHRAHRIGILRSGRCVHVPLG
ncbi:MAG: helix-turn-helix domain-containing protein [Opitutales bacterium]